jgi:hypothetical protein
VPLDFIVAGDDYGTARAPFFSTKVFETTILEPTVRFVEAVHQRGTRFAAHCCGVIDPFIPYLVEEIGVDGLEIQSLNNIPGILKKYGSRVHGRNMAQPASSFTDPIPLRHQSSSRSGIVDQIVGAQTVPGSGVILNLSSGYEHIFYPMEEEFYEYSRVLYA